MADFLFDAGDAPTGGHQQRSGVGVQPALKQREQSGFTCAVLAYDTDALAGIDHKIGAVQQHLGATAQCQTGSANHEASCSLVSIRIWSSVFSVLSLTGSSWGKLGGAAWRERGRPECGVWGV